MRTKTSRSLLILVLVGLVFGCQKSHTPFELPNLEEAEPAVQQAILEAHQQTIDNPNAANNWREFADYLRLGGWNKAAADAYLQGAETAEEPSIYFYLAGVSLESIDLAAAEQAFELAGKHLPNDGLTTLRLAEIKERLGKTDEAEQLFESAKVSLPDNPRILLREARIKFEGGSIDEARTFLQRLPEYYRVIGPVASLITQIETKAGNTWAAEEASRNARQHAGALPWDDDERTLYTVPPVGSVALLKEGNRLQRMGDYRGAASQYREALKHDPNNAEIYYAIGTAAALEGDFDRAERAYLAGHERDPNNREILFRLGRLSRRAGKLDQAEDFFEELAQLDSAYEGLSLEKGRLLLEQGNYDQALKQFRETQMKNPWDTRGWMYGGVAAAKSGRTKEAIQQLRQAVKVDPKNRDGWFNLAVTLAENQQFGEARTQLMEATRLHPHDRELQRLLERVPGG